MKTKVVGYDFYYDDSDFSEVITTHWNDGSKDIEKYKTIGRNGMFSRELQCTLKAVPPTAKLINKYRVG